MLIGAIDVDTWCRRLPRPGGLAMTRMLGRVPFCFPRQTAKRPHPPGCGLLHYQILRKVPPQEHLSCRVLTWSGTKTFLVSPHLSHLNQPSFAIFAFSFLNLPRDPGNVRRGSQFSHGVHSIPFHSHRDYKIYRLRKYPVPYTLLPCYRSNMEAKASSTSACQDFSCSRMNSSALIMAARINLPSCS